MLQLFLIAGRKGNNSSLAIVLHPLLDLAQPLILLLQKIVLAEIYTVDDGLGCQQVMRIQKLDLLEGEVLIPDPKAGCEHSLDLLEDLHLLLGCLVIGLCDLLLEILDSLFSIVQILGDELLIDHLHVPDRVYILLDVQHILVLKCPDNMIQPIHLLDIGEKLIAESGLALALDSSNIDYIQRGSRLLFRFEELDEIIEPNVRHLNLRFIRLFLLELVAANLHFHLRQDVEQRRFADIRQTDNTHFKCISRTAPRNLLFNHFLLFGRHSLLLLLIIILLKKPNYLFLIHILKINYEI